VQHVNKLDVAGDVGPLISALDAWLAQGPPDPPIIEDWLQPV